MPQVCSDTGSFTLDTTLATIAIAGIGKLDTDCSYDYIAIPGEIN
jgi:hypothetical protein